MSFSFSGNCAGKVEVSVPHSYLQRSIHAALARSLYTREGFEVLGRQLATIARHAYFARQMDTVEQASQLMLALPLSKELKSIAQYYQAICTKQKGDFASAKRLFEVVAENATSPYRSRAILSIAATYFDSGEIENALSSYLAAARAARESDFLTLTQAQWMAAVIRSIYGDHKQVLDDFERLFPAIQAIRKYYPATYYNFLNSYAVELGEVGRISEAQNVCDITLASPFAAAYPEFAQTHDELAARRTAATSSIIAVPAAPEIISSAQAQVEPEPAPARARSNISLKLRRSYLHRRVLTTMPNSAVIPLVSTLPILDWLAESIWPRGPPILS